MMIESKLFCLTDSDMVNVDQDWLVEHCLGLKVQNSGRYFRDPNPMAKGVITQSWIEDGWVMVQAQSEDSMDALREESLTEQREWNRRRDGYLIGSKGGSLKPPPKGPVAGMAGAGNNDRHVFACTDAWRVGRPCIHEKESNVR